MVGYKNTAPRIMVLLDRINTFHWLVNPAKCALQHGAGGMERGRLGFTAILGEYKIVSHSDL